MVTIVDVIVYILSIVVLWKAYGAEWKDLHCPTVSTPNENCLEFGGGMAYKGTKPLLTDTNAALLDRIERATYTEELTVKWRRCYILSFAITIAIWFLIFYPIISRFPRFYEYILMLFISMMVIYYSFNYYFFHHYAAPIDNVRKSIDALRDRMGLSRELNFDLLS